MEFKPTTALRKIAGQKGKIKGIQGGQGAGKTISIMALLINHASSNENREIIVASKELTKMRLTVIKDFVNVMKSIDMFEESRFIAGTLYRFKSGSFIKFIGLDVEDVGKGFRCDVLFLNEGNKLNLETSRQMVSRAGMTFIDFNPDENFWYHTEYKERDDCSHLQLCYADNEYLPEGEKKEILMYKEKGYNPDGSVKNEYWANKWQVYGLGNVGRKEFAVFNNWHTFDYLPEKNFYRMFGIDWGGADPTTLIQVDINHSEWELYITQHVYQPQILNSKFINKIQSVNPENHEVICDASRKDKIFELQNAGINAFGSSNQDKLIISGIEKLQEYTIFVKGEAIEKELTSYSWATDKATGQSTGKPEDDNNHIIDCLRYVIRFYHRVVNTS